MKLSAAIGAYQTEIKIRDDDAHIFAEIDDRRYELDVHEAPHGGYLIISNGRVFDCRIDGRPESGKTVKVFVGTTHFAITLTDPKRLYGASSAGAHDGDMARIVAPMPGKVVRVLVELGASIEAGAGIVVVEAMKMQNEMKSPKAGAVTLINVEAGATVNAGDVLAVIE